ncbi:MAG: hypothetical protein IPO81_23000 [Kouleothrix sp.]|nr:hypothetical protein [Kouleothrix sp.]
MKPGVVKPPELIKALCALGGHERHRGGETIIWFPGTTIIIGRRPFSRSMLHRVTRKLAAGNIPPEALTRALNGD